MDPVGLCTVHHEGAGAPATGDAQIGRVAHGGYTYGIGTDKWVRFRSVATSYATLNFNHRSLDLVLTGNRMTYGVTASDITLIHGAYMDAFARREVDGFPQVRAHRNSPGSSTVCPGNKTMDVWDQVVAACRPSVAPAPTPEPPPKQEQEMQVIAVSSPQGKSNEQPFGYLDTVARKVWSCWGFKISWDGGSGDSPLQGTKDPRSFGVPGTAPLVGWEVLSVANDGETKRIVAYGVQGAEYAGTAHG